MTSPSSPRARAAGEETDGRRRRSQDSRARIVQAMLELVHAGDPSPGAEQVAERAGVGLRTVFRHFSDMDSLYREMSAVIEKEYMAVVERPFEGRTWRERVLELVRRRAGVYEKIAPYKLGSNVHRHRSPFLQSDHARLVTTAREILRRELPTEVARDRALFEALDLMLSFEAWMRLRRDQDLTPRRAVEVLEAAIVRLLKSAPDSAA